MRGLSEKDMKPKQYLKGPTVVDMEDDLNPRPLQESTYVEAYMKFMYWTCVSPFNPTRSWNCHGASSWSEFTLNIIQKVSGQTFSVIYFILHAIEATLKFSTILS